MGTVPTGTVECAMIASRVASRSLPVERSMTVSAPYFTASSSLATSSPMLEVTAELPMLALILTRATCPMAIGSRRPARCRTLAGMISRPRATSSRTSSGARSSRSATKRIASVISPCRAYWIWVAQVGRVMGTPSAGPNRVRFKGCDLSPLGRAGTPVATHVTHLSRPIPAAALSSLWFTGLGYGAAGGRPGGGPPPGAGPSRWRVQEGSCICQGTGLEDGCRPGEFAGRRLPVPAFGAPVTLPFLAQAEGIEPRGAVHGEHTVEMVNLVLQQLGERALGVKAVAPPREVLVLHGHPVRPVDPDHQVGEREAVIPHQEILISDIHDFRIDQRPALGVFGDEHQPDRRPDLRGRDGAAVAVPLLPVAECVPQVVRHDADSRRAGVSDRLAACSEDRVPEEPNAMNRHAPNLRPDGAGERRRP